MRPSKKQRGGGSREVVRACESAVPRIPLCNNEHSMAHEQSPRAFNLTCDMCATTLKRDVYIWQCQKCDFDVCEACGLVRVESANPGSAHAKRVGSRRTACATLVHGGGNLRFVR